MDQAGQIGARQMLDLIRFVASLDGRLILMATDIVTQVHERLAEKMTEQNLKPVLDAVMARLDEGFAPAAPEAGSRRRLREQTEPQNPHLNERGFPESMAAEKRQMKR